MAVREARLLGREPSNGRYHVIRELGEGGMAVVYQAFDRRLATDVVIKTPLPALLADRQFVERFRLETQALTALAHPHILKVLDAGVEDGIPFLVMQYLKGGNLESRQRSLREIRTWLPQVCGALDFMHGKGFVHRDIKPDNILFDQNGNAYLGDFGIVKTLADAEPESRRSGKPKLTRTGMVIGTPDYMAPEVILGEAYDGRADQYALGVTLHELFAGERPFTGASSVAIMLAHTQTPPPDLRTILPQAPPQLAAAILRALAKDPRERFPDCAALGKAVLSKAPRALPVAKALPVAHSPPPVDTETAIALGTAVQAVQELVNCPPIQNLQSANAAVEQSPVNVEIAASASIVPTSSGGRKQRASLWQRFDARLGAWAGEQNGLLHQVLRVAVGLCCTLLLLGAGFASYVVASAYNRPAGKPSSKGSVAKSKPKTSSAGGAKPIQFVKGKYVSVLSSIDLANPDHVKAGRWTKNAEGHLKVDASHAARVSIPLFIQMDKNGDLDCSLRIEFVRDSGSDAVDVVIPLGENGVSLVMNGWPDRGPYTALCNLRGISGDKLPEAIRGVVLEPGGKHTLEINWSLSGLSGHVDFTLVRPDGKQHHGKWNGDVADLAHQSEFHISNKLGFGAFHSSTTFTDVQLKVTKGAAEFFPGASLRPSRPARSVAKSQPLFHSQLVTKYTPGRAVSLDVDIEGAQELFLVVTDGEDGNTSDWANWADPEILLESGESIRLDALNWKRVQNGFGRTRLGKNFDGGAMRLDGKLIQNGIGTHSPSTIAYDLPAGAKRFKCLAGLDDECCKPSVSNGASVRFSVYTASPPGFSVPYLPAAAPRTSRPTNSIE